MRAVTTRRRSEKIARQVQHPCIDVAVRVPFCSSDKLASGANRGRVKLCHPIEKDRAPDEKQNGYEKVSVPSRFFQLPRAPAVLL